MKKTSKNGQIFICSSCKKIHFEFGNIGMDFQSPEKLNELLKYLQTVNSNHFETEDLTNNYRRKILIPFVNSSVKLLLSGDEITEIIKLIVSFTDKLENSKEPALNLISLKSINYLNGIILN